MWNPFKKKAAATLPVGETFRSRCESFAQWFTQHAEEFDGLFSGAGPTDPEALVRQVGDEVNKVLPGLSWCFGPAREKEGHAFLLSPEGHKYHALLTSLWVAQAPKLERWEFHPAKPPGEATGGLKIRGLDLMIGDIQIALEPNDEASRPNLCFYHELLAPLPEEDKMQIIFIALDEVLGEDGTAAWLADISPAEEALTQYVPLSELSERLQQFYELMEWEQPSSGFNWSLISFEDPDPQPKQPRRDILTLCTCIPRLLEDFLEADGGFQDPTLEAGASLRYLSFPVGFLPAGKESEMRGHIEDCLDSNLRLNQAGMLLGGGLGLQSCYIDLLLTDGEQSEAVVFQVVRQLELPEETTLHYFHAALSERTINL